MGVREDARARFAEGLLLGAMVGAAIAGSTLWSRWRRSLEGTRRGSSDPEPHTLDR
jgi:hypothetical protein